MMKRKERINRARLHKLARLGIGLAAFTALGGGISSVGDYLFSNPSVVYAETYTNTSDQPIVVVVHYHGQNLDGTTVSLTEQGKFIEFQPGQEIAAPREFEGYTLTESSYIPPAFSEGILMYTYTQNAPKQPEQPEQQSLPYTVEWYLDGQYYYGYTRNIEPGELRDRWFFDKGAIPIWHDFAELAENSPWNYKITYEKVAAGENYYRFDLVSKDKATVPYTIELVDQDGQVLRTIQQSGVEGTEVAFDFPVISGYRIGKTEGFESGTVGKNGSFRLVANKTVKVYYDKAPSIDLLIRPEQRVEYQNVFDAFHRTVLKAFEVYKKELGVDDITYEANDLEKIFADSNLSVLHSELVLVKPLFDKPVGLVLTDQDIINAVGWTPEYWDYQIAYHKEITQKLEKALANIAASKATTTDPVDQQITIKAVYTEEQIEPGQKVDVLKEIEYTLNPGESIVLEPLTFEGWTSRAAHERQTVTYEDAKNSLSKSYTFYYLKDYTIPTDKQVEQPVEIPTETPNEQPVEQPVETPAETPSETPANRPAETPTNVQTNANPAGQSASEKQETKEQESSKLTSQYTYKDITGTSSSVTVRVRGEDVAKVASLSIKEENDPAVIAKLPQVFAEQQVDLYDIKTLDAAGQFVQITEDATVTLPVEAGKEVDKVIYFLASTGAVEELPFTVDKATNQVSFVVSHFSHYGIVYQANKPVSQAQSGSTGQSAPGKQETKQEAKEQAAPASPSKQATAKSAPTSQPQAKSLPATGEAHSVLHMTGMGLLGLAGLVVKRRSRKSS